MRQLSIALLLIVGLILSTISARNLREKPIKPAWTTSGYETEIA